MGGRGAALGLPIAHPSGNGGNGNQDWTQTPDIREAETLRAAIGEKGRPKSITEAAKGANPYYNGDYREFSENCQRAVVAFEARRRGYDVVARPTYEGDNLPSGAYRGKRGEEYGRWMGAFKNAKPEAVGARKGKQVLANINSKMQEWGIGSRAILSFGWKKGNSGHVINLERRSGVTVFVDAQTGDRYIPRELMGAIRTTNVTIVRTDNLRFSERAKKSLEKAGSR